MTIPRPDRLTLAQGMLLDELEQSGAIVEVHVTADDRVIALVSNATDGFVPMLVRDGFVPMLVRDVFLPAGDSSQRNNRWVWSELGSKGLVVGSYEDRPPAS
jgi:hypothetical protein